MAKQRLPKLSISYIYVVSRGCPRASFYVPVCQFSTENVIIHNMTVLANIICQMEPNVKVWEAKQPFPLGLATLRCLWYLWRLATYLSIFNAGMFIPGIVIFTLVVIQISIISFIIGIKSLNLDIQGVRRRFSRLLITIFVRKYCVCPAIGNGYCSDKDSVCSTGPMDEVISKFRS